MTNILLSLFMILSSLNLEYAENHGFHISFCTMNYKEANIEVSLNLVLDDIEEVLEKEAGIKLNLCTEKENDQAEQFLIEYLKAHFKIEIEGAAKEWNWVGKEITEDLTGIWCYFEVKGVENIGKIELRNDILINDLEDQKNIIDFIGPKGEKGYLMFHKGNVTGELEF